MPTTYPGAFLPYIYVECELQLGRHRRPTERVSHLGEQSYAYDVRLTGTLVSLLGRQG